MSSAGSSGGTAGVVASRGVAGGFCSDTAGSCRIPGAHTGTVGFRPSLNCYKAAGGIVPQTTSRDTVGNTIGNTIGNTVGNTVGVAHG